ncbi:Jojoba acyl CoA reductase-related male sterility protein [Perilla frutescens var. hirtella]|nr:Jojoba acyl CoA reductase-related male sterility protein [Perilla frutescens var. frutescens]KAH6793619.1 Jojoba acyl CoA reductase-related male sterility protein [Perilla frutescens var. hirtella]
MEELGSILQFLENRSILVTVFIEKILRVQPHVKKLYLLLRAADTKSAMLRFNNEIIEKELFKVLKEQNGGNPSGLISEKIKVVAGDITFENLGVKESDLLEEMFTQVDVMVNLAATTNFDERYDVSLGINTLGAKHVLNFSKKCIKLKILVHVSTAFVSGEREGLILESPYKIGETLNGRDELDIDEEKRLIDETLKHLKAHNSSEDSINSAMKALGIQRARKYGWPNTYVFTKAMGEMLLGQLKQNIPLVIIRPTIITSTYKEPFPGWVEGIRTIDSLAVGYGKGKLTCFLGDPKTIVDVIPADMVVNAIIVAMVAHADQANESIYHVGSSVSSPVEFTWMQDYGLRYFTAHPWIDKNGKPIIVGKVTVFDKMESFQRYMNIRYFLPLKGLQILNAACCQYFQRVYNEQSRKLKFVMRLIELYAPYLFFKAFYDDMNTEKLRRAAQESGVETDTFYFDPKSINWDDYFMNTHIPGVVKRVFKNT